MANANYLKIQKNLDQGRRIAFDLDVNIKILEKIFKVTNEQGALDEFYRKVIPIIKKSACMFIINPLRFSATIGGSMMFDYLLHKTGDEHNDIPTIVECGGICDERIAQEYVVDYLFSREHVAGVILPATTSETVFATIARENGKIIFVDGYCNILKYEWTMIQPIFQLKALERFLKLIYTSSTDVAFGVDMLSNFSHEMLLRGYMDGIQRSPIIMARQSEHSDTIIRIPLSQLYPLFYAKSGDEVFQLIEKNLQSRIVELQNKFAGVPAK